MGSFLRAHIALVIVAVILSYPSAIAQNTSSQTELRIVLRVVSQNRSIPLFEVELTNTAERDLLLNLGYMVGNGRSQFPAAIHLTLRNPQNDTEILELKGPPLMSGRVDQFLLPLPKGARFTIPINVADYWSPARKTSDMPFKAGRYFLSAEYRGDRLVNPNPDMQGIRAMSYWSGKAVSDEISFSVPE